MATTLFILNYINRCIYYKHKNTYFISIIRFTSNKPRQSYENRSLPQPIILQMRVCVRMTSQHYRAADWLKVSAISHPGGGSVAHPVTVQNM